MQVSVYIIVLFFRPGPNKVSSIDFPKPEGMPRRLTAYVHERAGGATVAARQDACADHEGTCGRRHHDHKTHFAKSQILEQKETFGVAQRIRCGSEVLHQEHH